MQYPFSDLVSIPDIQRILDSFYSSNGIAIEILDLEGQIIVASPGRNIYPGELYKYVWDIRLENRNIATLVLGPVLHAPPDEDNLRRLAQESGFDEVAFLEAVRGVPIVSEGQAEAQLNRQPIVIKFLNETPSCRRHVRALPQFLRRPGEEGA